jgi:hypothetical protein
MGRKSRSKWMTRAEIYEGVVLKQGPDASKEYLEQFQKKLDKFMKGAQELEDEREDLEEEEEKGKREPKPD